MPPANRSAPLGSSGGIHCSHDWKGGEGKRREGFTRVNNASLFKPRAVSSDADWSSRACQQFGRQTARKTRAMPPFHLTDPLAHKKNYTLLEGTHVPPHLHPTSLPFLSSPLPSLERHHAAKKSSTEEFSLWGSNVSNVNELLRLLETSSLPG